LQWLETWAPKAMLWHGQHSFQVGSVLAYAEDEGKLLGRKVQLKDATGHQLQDITYGAQRSYQLNDAEPSVYAQDHWILNPQFAIDAGLRWETQSLTSTTRLAPRAGFAWTPTKDGQTTVIRGGMGVFYDQVPLDTYAFRSFPQQTVTTYDGQGNITDGPRLFYNLTSTQPRFAFSPCRSGGSHWQLRSLLLGMECRDGTEDPVFRHRQGPVPAERCEQSTYSAVAGHARPERAGAWGIGQRTNETI
jgi:hypothetical protein